MNTSIRKLTFSAVIGALYSALTIATGFMSFGPLQFRVAEVMNILPFFFPETAGGLFVGCFLSNLISGFGFYDLIFGSLATLVTAMLTVFLGRNFQEKKWAMLLSCLLPVLINGAVIGFVIAATSAPAPALGKMTVVYGIQVGAGELIVMGALGVPAMLWFPGSRLFAEIRYRLYGERKM